MYGKNAGNLVDFLEEFLAPEITQVRPARPAGKKARKAGKKKATAAKRPLETKPVPASADQSPDGGKFRIDKRKLMVYDAILRPKFDE